MLQFLPIVALALAQPPASPPASTAPAQPAVSQPGTSEQVVTEATVKPPPKVLPGGGDDKFADSDALLSALETAGRKIKTLTADLTHVNRKSELEAGQTITKRGRLYFQNDDGDAAAPADTKGGSKPADAAPPHKGKLFQIEFNKVEFGDQRNDEDQTFIFDGQWLVEKHFKDKQMFKYRVVPPGQTTDPLAVGEGPFPIPIGQKKDRILDRFWVTLMPPDDGFPAPLKDAAGNPNPKMAWVMDTYQLRLIPKPSARESRDFQEIRLWYRKGDLMPRVAKTVKLDETSDEVLLTNVDDKAPIPPGTFDTTQQPGWDVQIDEFRQTKADK